MSAEMKDAQNAEQFTARHTRRQPDNIPMFDGASAAVAFIRRSAERYLKDKDALARHV